MEMAWQTVQELIKQEVRKAREAKEARLLEEERQSRRAANQLLREFFQEEEEE